MKEKDGRLEESGFAAEGARRTFCKTLAVIGGG